MVERAPGQSNPLWKYWRKVGKGHHSHFFMEHHCAVLESLRAERSPLQVLISEERYHQNPAKWDQLSREGRASWFLLEEKSLNAVVSVSSSSGLCGLYEPKNLTLEELKAHSFLLISYELNDPGNLGTLIRSCTALTKGALLAIGGCKLWTSKVARASAGSLLSASVAQISLSEAYSAIEHLKEAEFQMYSAVPQAALPLPQVAWAEKSAVILGNESLGLPAELEANSQSFSLPMSSAVESLNVGVTGSIVCYQWGLSGSKWQQLFS